jgi:predicted HTH transcriptional regulator
LVLYKSGSDLLSKKYDLSKRQNIAIKYLLEHKDMSIKDFKKNCPKESRRTLQRDLKNLIDKAVIGVKLVFRMSSNWQWGFSA